MEEKQFKENLSSVQKRRLHDLQQEIFDSGKHKDKDFVQKECYNEAIKLLAKELGNEIE